MVNANEMSQPADGQTLTESHVDHWIGQLEQWTTIFYNDPSKQSPLLWQEAQNKLVQFQKLHNPLALCTSIIKKSRNPLVLYQATSCLKNAITYDLKRYNPEELFKLFQFLYEFLCAQALENEMSVNETAAFICAMTIKKIASERSEKSWDILVDNILLFNDSRTTAKNSDKITSIIRTLCNHVREPTESLSKKIASALMLSSLLLECHMTPKSSFMGLKIWELLYARKSIEAHLKMITEACLETINWAFTSNLMNPLNQNRETQIIFHLVGLLIQCVEHSLSFSSTDAGCASNGRRVLRVIQDRAINILSSDNNPLLEVMREWRSFITSPSVVQFLFHLYITIKSMVNASPGWTWPSNVLKNCLNCLYYLSDVSISYCLDSERDFKYGEFVGNLMLGAVKIIDAEVRGIDDSFQIASLMTSISIHTGESRDAISKLNSENFITFLNAAQRFTCKVFSGVAAETSEDDAEEEEKTVDALLDFWYQLLKNIEADIKWVNSKDQSSQPKIPRNQVEAYSRVVVENYISCHLHKPLGQVEPKTSSCKEWDLDQAEELDDNNIHAQQLVSFGMIARVDPLHTANLLIELLGTRVGHLGALLTQFITTKSAPDGIQDWEFINDDIHWLLLMTQHFLTQTGYGEVGFMCTPILEASVTFDANVQKTMQAFEKCDHTPTDVDPIVRLIILALKLCQIEMGVCQSGNISWLSVQTNTTLTTLLSRFCLTYLYPKESDYSIISENMNFIFGQDAPPAKKFLNYVVEHTCCVILCMKADPQITKKNVQLLTQLLTFHPTTRDMIMGAEEGSIIKAFVSQMRPENLGGFSPQVAKSIIKLATYLFVEDEEWNSLVDFFTSKWASIMTAIRSQQHQSEMVSNQFLEFCDYVIGVCEACDSVTSERLFDELLVPIVTNLPMVLQAFANFETIPRAVFEVLYFIFKLPMLNLRSWDSDSAKTFYSSCKEIIEVYAQINSKTTRKRGDEEEDCEDIISLLTFSYEMMKRDWGSTWSSFDGLLKFSMEKISAIVKPEHMQFPRLRTMYYRLLVYLVDEDDRIANLNDTLLNTIVSSILLALQSQFEKDVDNHVCTMISIICRTIYHEKNTEISRRLSKFMMPVLPAVFHSALNQGSFTINTEAAEMIAPALFSLRCCFLDLYKQLVETLIEKQDDMFVKQKVKTLFEDLESKIHNLPLNRPAIREFNSLFVPFLAELHNYIAVR